MKAILRTAAAAAALTLAATPALAAPQPQVQPTDRQATATARIVKPLTLVWAQDLDLGTVLLKNAGAYSATVGVTHAGVFDLRAPVPRPTALAEATLIRLGPST